MVEMFRGRRNEVIKEMGATQLIHGLFNLIFLTPIIVAGKIDKILVS